MDTMKNRQSEGNCIISEDVIATIASTAALEIPGVASMAQRPDLRARLGATAAKSVKVTNGETETVLDVYLNLKLGAQIQSVCGEVQRNVKVAVQSMTGKEISAVHVHVVGLAVEGENTEEQ